MIKSRLRPWFVILLAAVLLTALFLPASRAENGQRQETAALKRARLQAEIRAMEREIKANGWTFQVGFNEAMQYDLKQLCGFNPALAPKVTSALGAETPPVLVINQALPSAYTGVYTSVKNQASCGSCWAFSTIAGLEAAVLKTTGHEVDLSEQHLVSCNPWNWGCNGGYFAFDMIDQGNPYYPGAMPETCFPYAAVDAPCAYCANPVWTTSGAWAYVAGSNKVPSVDQIKQAIYTYGSVSVGVYVDRYFQAYKSGVFTACKKSVKSINHAVILCGWDAAKGAWLLKNSWGTSWGDKGFMWMKYGCNKVGYGACWVTY